MGLTGRGAKDEVRQFPLPHSGLFKVQPWRAYWFGKGWALRHVACRALLWGWDGSWPGIPDEAVWAVLVLVLVQYWYWYSDTVCPIYIFVCGWEDTLLCTALSVGTVHT